jgi:hypothetical protein
MTAHELNTKEGNQSQDNGSSSMTQKQNTNLSLKSKPHSLNFSIKNTVNHESVPTKQ